MRRTQNCVGLTRHFTGLDYPKGNFVIIPSWFPTEKGAPILGSRRGSAQYAELGDKMPLSLVARLWGRAAAGNRLKNEGVTTPPVCGKAMERSGRCTPRKPKIKSPFVWLLMWSFTRKIADIWASVSNRTFRTFLERSYWKILTKIWKIEGSKIRVFHGKSSFSEDWCQWNVPSVRVL